MYHALKHNKRGRKLAEKLGFYLVQARSGVHRLTSLLTVPGGTIVERWVRGRAAQIGCRFGLSNLPMIPFLFEN